MKFIPTSLLRYGIVGLGTNGVLYAVFLALLWAGMPPVYGAVVCYIAGVCLSYLLNRSWSFDSTRPHKEDLPRFLVAYAVGLLATAVFISILTRFLRPEISQILNIGLTALVIYVSLSVTGFGKKPHAG